MAHSAGVSSLVRILGIETSCDETAAAVVDAGPRVRSSAIASQHELHAPFAGVVPELAGRAHVERILPVIDEALASAGVRLESIDAVAVGHRPGLIGALLVGVSAGKALAWSLGRPLIGVDHVRAHVYSAALAEAGAEPAVDPSAVLPALGLVVSGGHTTLFRVDGWAAFTRLGGTIDDALGEAFDKAAAILGLPHPGGPNVERLAATPGASDRAEEFPVSRIAPGSLDFSFSGLKTALLYAARGVPDRRGIPAPAAALTDARRADLAASFQRAAIDAVALKVGRALDAHADLRTILAGGGVLANAALRRRLAALAAERDVTLRLARPEYCGDNAAMIAGLGRELLAAGHASDLSLEAEPTATP